MIELVIERRMLPAPKEAVSTLRELGRFLRQQRIDCYVVGGLIRDYFLQRVTNDIDIVVDGDALDIASRAAAHLGATLVPLDEANQVARLVFPLERGNWHIDFTALRGDMESDLACRDFTINAIAVPLDSALEGDIEGTLIDPLRGRDDLKAGILRAVSDTAFADDPLRLLRAIRFAATLGFRIEPTTESLGRRDSALVSSVAAERIRDELGLILGTPIAYESLRKMDDLGILDRVLPELTCTKGVEQPKEHFWDVFDHSLHTVEAMERVLHERSADGDDELLAMLPWSPEISAHFSQEVSDGRSRRALSKLAALLHDIGKPATKAFDPDGRMRFLGHTREGALMAGRAMARLRFSNREAAMVELMVEHHLRPGFLAREETPSRRAIYRYFRDASDVGIDTLYLGLADHLAARGPTLDPEEWRKHVETTRYVLSKYFEDQSTIAPPKLIDGHVLMDEFSLEPGPRIGQLLEMVREAQAAGEVTTREQALQLVRENLESS
jgi:poly(A) polymerase